jgi:hypothetical protein
MVLASQLPDELMKEFEKLNLGMTAHTEGVTLEVESYSGAADTRRAVRGCGDQGDQGEGQGPGFHGG